MEDLSNSDVFNKTEPSLENATDCKLPWKDYVETSKDSNVDIVILICLLLTLFFDTFLIAIILAHDDLRKKRVNLFMISICISDMSFALYLIALVQPGFNEGRYADFVNETYQRCKWSQVIGTFLMTAPWYNFLGLNAERLYAIKRPIDFRISLQRHSWSRVILVCWALAILPAIPLMFTSTVYDNWEGKTNCKCFLPIDDKVWVFWACITNFLIPTLLIFSIWGMMLQHFIVNPPNNISSRVLKRATIKMVFITGLFLLTVSPFCFVFAAAGFQTPESTRWLDWFFFLPLLNGTFQPVIYIFSFERLREVFFKVIRCERSKKGGRMAMVLAIYRTTRSLSGNFNNKEVSSQNPRNAAKHSVVSQMTILSGLDPTSEVLDTSLPVFLEEDSQQMSPLMLPTEIAFPQSRKSDGCRDETNE